MSLSARAFVAGCEGRRLSDSECAFFSQARPWGLILFHRNCDTRDQIRALVGTFRDCVERDDAPVLIDQEGGRVMRLKPPEWRAMPSARALGAVYARDPEAGREAVRLHASLLARDLRDVGITIDCLPVVDVPAPGSDAIIGDRAYGTDAVSVGDLARCAGETLLAHGVLPVIKHMPGHGRADVDSHASLPVVQEKADLLQAVDFAAFTAVADFPVGMTAHVVYQAFDRDAPATLSKTVIEEVIRGRIGFDGLLLTDDISMRALGGPLGERARAALTAGCDIVLHCNGDMAEMEEIAAAVPVLAGSAEARADAALARICHSGPNAFDPCAIWAKLQAILESPA